MVLPKVRSLKSQTCQLSMNLAKLFVVTLLFNSVSTLEIKTNINWDDFIRSQTETSRSDHLSKKIITINQNLVVASTIRVTSDEISLIGQESTLLFSPQPDDYRWPLSSPGQKLVENHIPTTEHTDNTHDSPSTFMFDIWNSSFSANGIEAILTCGNTGLCFISGSSVAVSSSIISSNGLISPFLMMVSDSGLDNLHSRIVLSEVTHTSASDFLPSFVDVSHPLSSSSLHPASSSDDPIHRSVGGVSVVGIGLRLSDSCLASGTGPLFSFGLNRHASPSPTLTNDLPMETALVQSSLVNMSSRSTTAGRESEGSLFGSNAKQRIVGSEISKSANHQRGTAMLDPNMGGCLVCLNTSFSSCHTHANTDQAITRKDHVQGDLFNTSQVTSTSVSFTLCTFNDMSIKNGYDVGGAAIRIRKANADLTVSQCFFHKCCVTGSIIPGSTIQFAPEIEDKNTASIELSSFTECQSIGSVPQTAVASALFLKDAATSTVSQNFFHLCNATGRNGAIELVETDAMISNCSFVECASLNSFGGAIGFVSRTTLSLVHTHFRDCWAMTAGSCDVASFNKNWEQLNSTSVQFCDSTSGSPNIYDSDSNETDGTLIPQLGEDENTFIAELKMSFEGAKCVVEITTNTPLNGAMGLLLDGGNVPRCVHVQFGSDGMQSTTGSVEVSSDDHGVLPTLADGRTYAPRRAAIAGKRFLTSVYHVQPRLTSSSTLSLSLSGYLLHDEVISMKVKNAQGDSFTIPLDFSRETELTGTTPLSSTDATQLEYEKEYAIESFTTSSTTINFRDGLKFTTPSPPAILTSSTQTDGNDSMTLSFSGTGLVAASYTLTLTEQVVEGTPHTATVTLHPISDTKLEEWDIALFPHQSTQLKYGSDYKVTQMTSTIKGQITTINTPVITTPDEPPRVTSISNSRYPEKEKKVEFEVNGLMMKEGETYTMVVNATGTTTEKQISVTFSSQTEGSGSATLFPLLGADLEYNTNYTLTNVLDSKSNPILFLSGLTFETKAEPSRLLTLTRTGYGTGKKTVEFSMTGRELDETSKYFVGLSLSGNEKHKVLMSMNGSSNNWEGSASLFPLLGAALEYGKTYSVSSLTKVGDPTPLLFEDQNVEIETEPARLVSTSLSEIGGPNSATLVLESRELTPNAKYEISLSFSPTSPSPSSSSSNSDSTTSLNVTVKSKTDNSFLLALYPESTADLVYGQTYVVTSMKTGLEESILIEGNDCSFVSPSEPARLASIGVGEMISDGDTSTITLSFSSFSLQPSTSYTFEFGSSASEGEVSHTKTLTLTTEADGSLSPHVMTLFPRASSDVDKKSQFEFDQTYLLTSFKQSSKDILFDAPTPLVIEADPTRITHFVTASLSKDRSTMTVIVAGRSLSSLTGKLFLTDGSKTWESLSNALCSSTQCSAIFNAANTQTDQILQFGLTYQMASPVSSNYLVCSGISVPVPFPPRLTSASFDFANSLNISCIVSFAGIDLEIGKTYTVALSETLSFNITVRSVSIATSDQLPLGWADTLQFATEYQIQTITPTNNEDGKVDFTALSFTTKAKPSRLSLFVDSAGSDSISCGTEADPCSSINVGWRILSDLHFSKSTLSIIHNTTQTSRMTVGSADDELVIHAGPSTKPELVVSSPSSPMGEGEGMIDVSKGRVWLNQVDVVLSDSPSLVLIRVVSGHLSLQLCSFTHTIASHSNNPETFSCSWTSGVIVLEETDSTIEYSTFSNLPLGAISQKGGTLSIVSSSFFDNAPVDSLFPSARRNIHCEGTGQLIVGSLSGGDGLLAGSSGWIDVGDCSLSGMESLLPSPLFAPVLSSDSTCSLNKKDKSFSISIVGTTLIPCGLSLEVYEITKKGKEGRKSPFDLSQTSTLSFIDEKITLSLPQSSFSSFDSSLEWRGRLIYGNGVHTNTSFTIQMNSSDRFAELSRNNMKWWLPLIIVLSSLALLIIFLIVFCCHRRKNQKKKDLEPKEMDDSTIEDEKIEDIITDNRIGVNPVNTLVSADFDKFETSVPKSEPSDSLLNSTNIEEALVCGGGEMKTTFVSNDRTLFNALHSENKWEVQRREVERQIVKGLSTLVKKDRQAAFLKALTAHNILLDTAGNVCFRLNLSCTTQSSLPVSHHNTHLSSRPVTHLETGKANEAPPAEPNTMLSQPVNEGARWSAPEVIEKKANADASHGAVFSLGLVLWEMETGLVPFGEIDAVNASRQIVAGTTPRLEIVKNSSIRELIRDCLAHNASERPELDEVLQKLEEIPADDCSNINVLLKV
ncbi:hypothetical protein BLNAU_13254 [Blattamonas nauphoetae]|uniref:Protein kinase domain-containing protein n=1 Tax=Blattamonas nauphoetae TaxID=2049346 RepID=A0ABQ9XNC2_9EUKA|nr:hypothetical protein BLNAU_13254 [Blattamonas nauphoetae]